MLAAINLQCVRGSRTLFSGLGFGLQAGELLRVAGANGSGKTSLLRIVCGLLAPAEGEVRWHGEAIARLREEFWRSLVYIGHASAVKDDLTALENLVIACTLAGVETDKGRAGAALRHLGLAGCEHLPAGVLSQGQRRRVVLARLVLSDRLPLWVLDEPLAALDGAAMDCIQQLVAGQLARGGAVIYSTHVEMRIDAAASLSIDLDSGKD